MFGSKYLARECNKRIISKHYSSFLQVITSQVIIVRPVLLSGRGTSTVLSEVVEVGWAWPRL
jgi:pyrimidine operon attenuation protein/uracil phosphoribosyltransferase